MLSHDLVECSDEQVRIQAAALASKFKCNRTGRAAVNDGREVSRISSGKEFLFLRTSLFEIPTHLSGPCLIMCHYANPIALSDQDLANSSLVRMNKHSKLCQISRIPAARFSC